MLPARARERRAGVDVYRSEAGRDAIRRWCAERLAAAHVAIERRVVPTRAGDTHVALAGDDGPLVVLVPGTNFTAVQWLDVVERLAPTHRVAALDLPGQPGLSAPLRIPRAHDSYVVVLDEVLAGLGARAEVVVGHSLGARAALAAAARGVAIDRLVLVNPAGLARLRVGVRAMSASLGWLARPDDVHARVLLQRMTAPDFALHPDLVQWMATVGAHVRTTLAPPRLPARQRRAVRVPVAVVLGAHDPFISPGRVRRGARHLASATVEVVGDAGHLVPLERPDVVVDAVRSGV